MKYNSIRVCIEYYPIRTAYAEIESGISMFNRNKIATKTNSSLQHKIYLDILKELDNINLEGKLK